MAGRSRAGMRLRRRMVPTSLGTMAPVALLSRQQERGEQRGSVA
ncbi:MAG: hypothetical protein AVDCRST_MAG34-461 [uncultured Nocardioidaceae bacterium]|uniref:Uncharacterized protein n=1 Tax=uncultured Nocardioidaceae bacterium TaxID=253824 RepID=A0A6J4LHK3_9ACTN|nr:MAG: hypothetical protein AVDCRST_MAG34-461 [uncultured Nocardioidaceae bacterium]